MPIFSASSTCVSLRWRRSCRIFRPTSSSWAGLFMRVSLTFMLLKNKPAPNLRTAEESVKSGGSPTTKNLPLLRELVRRDFHARFTGSALGIFWAVLQPLSLVVVYWFVFTYMFTRGPAAGNDNYIRFLITRL